MIYNLPKYKTKNYNYKSDKIKYWNSIYFFSYLPLLDKIIIINGVNLTEN